MEFGIIIIKQIIIMFIILVLGIVCYNTKIITKDGNKQLSAIELNVVNPVLIFVSYQTQYNSQLMNGLLWAFLLSAISYLLAILLSMLFIKKTSADCSIERFAIVYSNCAFMGIPLINGVLGTEGVLYLTAYLTFFNLLVWTHGIMSMKGERDLSSFVKAIKSPSVIAVVVGLIFYVTNIRLPEVPASALQYVANLNTPLAMLIAGATIAQTNLLNTFKNKRIYLICLHKLLTVPLLTLLVFMLLPVPKTVSMTILIAVACPTATMGTLFAIKLNKNPQHCSEFFSMTTLLSAASMPLLTILADTIL